jgi:hypothetical protein
MAKKKTIYGLKDREYTAQCTLAHSRKVKEGEDESQVSDIKLVVHNISPDDAVGCMFQTIMFPARGNKSQIEIAEAERGELSDIQALDGEYSPGKEGQVSAYNIKVGEGDGSFTLYPKHGIAIKKIKAEDGSTAADPVVVIEIMVKGLPADECGRIDPEPWLLSPRQIRFVSKIAG